VPANKHALQICKIPCRPVTSADDYFDHDGV